MGLRLVVSVIKIKRPEDALRTANDIEFGLALGIATTSPKCAAHFERRKIVLAGSLP